MPIDPAEPVGALTDTTPVKGSAKLPDNSIDLDAAQALADRAQSLPWSMHVSDMDDRFAMILGTPTVEHVANYVHQRDAEFIVAARSLMPALISELRQARKALTEMDAKLFAVGQALANEQLRSETAREALTTAQQDALLAAADDVATFEPPLTFQTSAPSQVYLKRWLRARASATGNQP